MKKLALVALALIPLTNTALAESRSFNEYLVEENITTTNIKAQAIAKAKPDMFQTIIEYSETDRNAKEAQTDLNEEIAKATATIKANGLEYKLQNFSTYKHHDTNKFTARQTIVLENKDRAKIEKVTTMLQNQDGKVVRTTSFISPEGKQKFFEKLYAEAYNEAETKAAFMTKQLKGQKYTVTNVDYYMNERNYRPMMARAMAAEDAPANIELDDSKQDITLEMTMSIAIMKK